MADLNSRKLLEINIFLQVLVLTEGKKDLPHLFKHVKT